MQKHNVTLLITVALIMWVPSTWAKDPSSISLTYRKFQIPDEPEYIGGTGYPIMIPEKRVKKVGQTAVSKLQDLVSEIIWTPQDGYIQLSDTEFIVFVSSAGRLGLGLYLADLSTNMINQYSFAPGEPQITSILKDKSGNDYLLIHHTYPMRGGYAGESYSLMSAKKSSRGKAIVNLLELGNSESVSEAIEDECKGRIDTERVINKELAVSVADVNNDSFPDITVNFKQLNCETKETVTINSNYYATSNGFMSIEAGIVRRLLKAQKLAKEIYKKHPDSTLEIHRALEILENAGIRQFLYSKPKGMTTAAYVALLNDYAFLKGHWDAQQCVHILDRAIKLSPHRAVAFLNRAELLYQMLITSDLTTHDEQINIAKEIMSDYKAYKMLSKNTIQKWEDFTAFNLASYPKGVDVCSYVQGHFNARRINDIFLEARRLDINNDGYIDDVEVGHGEIGLQAYSQLTFSDANGNQINFKGSDSERFNIFAFEGKVYKLSSMNDVSYIDHDKEKLVCKSKWEVSNGVRVLKSVSRIESN